MLCQSLRTFIRIENPFICSNVGFSNPSEDAEVLQFFIMCDAYGGEIASLTLVSVIGVLIGGAT